MENCRTEKYNDILKMGSNCKWDTAGKRTYYLEDKTFGNSQSEDGEEKSKGKAEKRIKDM